MLVDTLGTGMLGPFDLLYGHAADHLSVTLAGIALSIGTAVAIPAGPVAGTLVDRLGVVPVTLLANAVSAAGTVWLLLSHGVLGFLGAVIVMAAGSRMFWAAFSPLVGLVTEGARRDWFGRIRSVRYAGLAGGQAVAGAVLLLGQVRGLHLLVAGDAVSFVLAGFCLAIGAGRATAMPRPVARDQMGGYRAVVRDPLNVAAAGLNILATLVIQAPYLAMPILVLDQLHLPAWLPGSLGALNTVAVAVPVFFIGALTRARRAFDVLAIAAGLWVLGTGVYVLAPDGRVLAWAVLPLGMALLGVGEAFYAPTADSLPLELAPPGLAGRYAAFHQLAWGISGAVAPTLAAFCLAGGPSDLWIVLAAVALLLVIAYERLAPALDRRLGAV